MNKKICDVCGKEISFNPEYNAHLNMGINGNSGRTSKGKEISTISLNKDLCLDCYQEIIEFLESERR